MAESSHDVVIVGAGHNGLVAAAYLARAGRSVLVLERRDHAGGAAVSERPFAGVDARLSRYAYLVSLLPGQIVDELGLGIELRRRRVSGYAPGVLIGPDPTPGWTRFYDTCARVARAVRPSLLQPLRTRAQLRAEVGDDAAWDALIERPIGELIEDCLEDDTLRGIALTDALIGTFAGAHDADLRQNRCLLYHVLAPWDVPVGGMGAVSGAIEHAARAAGAEIRCGVEVGDVEPGAAHHSEGVARAGHVLVGYGTERAEGAQLKVNFLLSRLPRLKDGTDPRDAFTGTAHINEGYAQLEAARAQAASGVVPDVVPCEVYCHSLTDPTILSPALRAAGAQTLTCFALHMPARLFPNDDALAATLRSLDSILAEPLEDCLWRDADGRPCIEARTPLQLEAELGLPGGNIFHRDLRWPFVEDDAQAGTWGVETDDPRILICGAGARRGGGVSGVPGRNAAMAVLSA